jgi:hypothetical protein
MTRRVKSTLRANGLGYLALFLALTATAAAAATIDSGNVVNNSLRTVDLKNNQAVRGIDVRNGSLRGNDVRRGSLQGAHVAANSLGGADIDEKSLTVSQRIAELESTTPVPVSPVPVPLPALSYTQRANESNSYIAGGQITFPASCAQPRSAQLYLFIDSTAIVPASVTGSAMIADAGTGSVSRRFNFGPYPTGPGLDTFAPFVATPHQFYLYGSASCNTGAGVTVDSVGLDVAAER